MRKLLDRMSHDPFVAAVVIAVPYIKFGIRQKNLKLFAGRPNMAAWQVVLCFYAVIVAFNLIASLY